MTVIIDGSTGIDTIQNATVTAAKIASGQTPAFNGIQFPATQAASADANTLDDYEEGTWTPTDGSGAGLTLTTNTYARYTKIGNSVSVSCFTNYPATASSASNLISGLPFAMNTNTYASGAIFTNSNQYLTVYFDGNSYATSFNMRTSTNATPAVSTFSGKFVCISFTYQTA